MKRSDLKPEKIRPYNKGEKSRLAEKYTPAQLAAIDAGEEAIDRNHLASQASSRKNHWSLKYFDDLSKIDPAVDHPIRAPYSNMDATIRLKTEDELDEDLAKFIHDLPENEDSPEADEAWIEFDKKLRLTVGKEEAEHNTRGVLAQDLWRPGELNLDGKIIKQPSSVGAGAQWGSGRSDEPTPGLLRLMQMTGYNQKQLGSLRVKAVIDHRVVNQTRLGKIGKQYYLSIAGNCNGLIGIGEGKSLEPQQARLQSQYRAIRNMQPILRYENRTTFGDVKGKVSATELELYARPPGKCTQPRLHMGEAVAERHQDSGYVVSNISGRSANVPELQILPPALQGRGIR
jgi:small subunit ribosomal protein S5